MTSKQQQQFALGRERIISNTYDPEVQKVRLDSTLLTKIDDHLKLLNTPPPLIAQRYQPLIDTVVKTEDPERIVWLSRKLKSIYLGAEFQSYLPGDWEDEAVLYELSA